MATSNGSQPEANQAVPSATEGTGKRMAPVLKAFQRALGGFLVVTAALGAYLYFYSTHQQVYLTGRDQRALASMSAQLAARLQAVDQLLRSVGKIRHSSGDVDSSVAFILAYRHLALTDRGQAFHSSPDAAECIRAIDGASAKADGKWRHVPDAPPYCLYRPFDISAGATTAGRAVAPVPARRGAVPRSVAYLNVSTFVRDFRAGVFDKAMLADASGQVLAETGMPEIVLTRLDSIVKGRGADSNVAWGSLEVGSNIGRASVSGKSYRAFLEPCCRLADGSHWDQPLILAGLVDNGRFVRDTLRISLSWVTILCAVLILLVLSWPFLKFRLMGEREPVRLADGMHLGLASFLAAAFSTIFLLDTYAYGRFQRTRDADLTRLSREIAGNFQRETAAARGELERLYNVARARKALTRRPDRVKIRKDDSKAFPFFESWSLLDSAGQQVHKWSTDAYVQELVPVADRAYFREINEGRGWAGLPTRYFVESTISRTTGKRQAALSMPASDSADSARPVVAMALEMLSLVGTVLPPGYGFAVLNDAGRVLFHSDPSRNLDESFFSETDDDRRLRSAVAARTADTLNFRYGGTDHRAYVAPMPGPPWVLVTFLDKEAGRITNAESLFGSIYLLMIYTLGLAVLGVLVLAVVPGYRIPWLWPDRRRFSAYLRIAVADGMILLAFLIAVGWLGGDDLLAAAFLLPLAATLASWSCLTPRRPGTASVWLPPAVVLLAGVALAIALFSSPVHGWPHAAVVLLVVSGLILGAIPPAEERTVAIAITAPYVTSAVLFILIVGALPAAAFFKVANAAHMEMLIKGSQLQIARRLEIRADSIRREYTDARGKGKASVREARLCDRPGTTELCGLDLYADAFFETRLESPRPAGAFDSTRAAPTALAGLFLAPYRPRASVEWRGTHPPGAEDRTWTWYRSGDRLEFQGSAAPGRPAIALSSAMRGLAPAGIEDFRTAGLLAGLVVLLVWAIAAFVARRVFLIDVTDPVIVSRDRAIRSVGGTNLFVVCRNAGEEESIKLFGGRSPIDLRSNLRPDALSGVVRRVSEGEVVMLKHFEYKSADQEQIKAKVGLLDTLVHEYNCNVVILSGPHRKGSPLGLRAAWRLVEATGQQDAGAAQVLESLVLVDAGRWLGCPETGDRRHAPAAGADASVMESLIAQEGRCDRHLRDIWHGLHLTLRERSPKLAEQGREELLDILGERAESYYQHIWESCRPGERCVLVHLAASGLVNEKDRRVLRRLLARGLIRREPNFVVMNETFRRYLLVKGSDVEAELLPQSSTWDTVQRPVLGAATGLVILLFVSQQELFSATQAIATALGSGLLTLTKITGLFDRRGSGRSA